VNYAPTVDRLLDGAAHTKNKQAAVAADAAQLTEESAANWLAQLSHLYEQAEAVYQAGLKGGVPKELARLAIPVARYSRMRAQAVLLNWFRFVSLRSAPNAQWEIRQYADAILALLGKFFPRSVELMQANPL
jgi:thymidylate synthase (FAD)